MSDRILCHGGPYDGIYHEVQEGWPIPDSMSLPHPTDESDPWLYRYEIWNMQATFTLKESR